MIDHPEQLQVPSTGQIQHASALPGQVQAVHSNMGHHMYGTGGYGGVGPRAAPPRRSSARRGNSDLTADIKIGAAEIIFKESPFYRIWRSLADPKVCDGP